MSEHTHDDDARRTTPAAATAVGGAGRGNRRRWVWVGVALLVQAGLVVGSVAPQVSARVLGEEYRLRVAPVDPIDPFRGAYVALSYPDLPSREIGPDGSIGPPLRGPLYVPLTRQGDVWRGGKATGSRPASGPYLACRERNFQMRCGIDSWFVPQKEAARLETALRDGHAIAVVRVDGHGNAALVDLVESG